MTASLTQMLPEIAAWAATLPAGILTLKPWLVPARAFREGPDIAVLCGAIFSWWLEVAQDPA